MQQERLIRKYSNRRLYDTGGSRHVTLEDLRQLIVAGGIREQAEIDALDAIGVDAVAGMAVYSGVLSA